MRPHVLSTYAESLGVARSLVHDVPCARFAELPHPGAKHPGWVLGHLCVASGLAAATLGDDPSEMQTLCGVPPLMAGGTAPGTEPLPERAAYATKESLLAELDRVHALTVERFDAASDERLAAEFPVAEYRDFWPTVGAAAFYLMARHEQYHLGQLSMWRRAAGLPAASPA